MCFAHVYLVRSNTFVKQKRLKHVSNNGKKDASSAGSGVRGRGIFCIGRSPCAMSPPTVAEDELQ